MAVLVERAIAHLLTPHAPKGSVYSSAELPLTKYPKIQEFLQKHIDKSLGHDELRTARFRQNGNVHKVRSLCHTMIERKSAFIKATRTLGELLNSAMSSNKRISAGTLAACLFRTSAEGDRRVGLLKLDPTETVVQRVHTEGQGTVVVWEPTDNALPSAGQDLQKCAFVHLPTQTVAHELQILDWQNRTSLEPAKFFTETFLEAELHADEALLTSKFHSIASRALESLRPTIGDKNVDAAKRLLDASLLSKKIVVNAFVDSLKISSEHADVLRRTIRAEIKESFSPDEATAERLLKKVKIIGEYGLRLTVEREHRDRVIRDIKEKTDPQYGPYRELTIRAFNFKED